MHLEPGERRRPIEGLRYARHLAQILLAHGRDHARDLQGERRVDARRARDDDPRLSVDVGEIDIVIEAAPAQRVGQFACAVRGQHDARDRGRLDRAELGNTDLEVGQKLEQERLEFLVGAIDLVDQKHRRLLAADRGKQRPLQQISSRKRYALRWRRHSSPTPSRVLMARSWR